ncbi:hypothetical protein Aph02nite_00160 [Actinoplanes philippinensis]|uniref:Septum formation n=1 Tax=Actinoplanes philippinensis TaxID=35752 RepID=A0A1I2HIL7_9ACTN|nr:hypothetical protein [Actinoplanes philippinensis]GIE74066.1 hypothetical protein Aph02nite_00160 [Actinoplanes philippinensis]SFF30125.1 hypothetical protein SAMN05421541_108276 [Actinoplanes philippinensis]
MRTTLAVTLTTLFLAGLAAGCSAEKEKEAPPQVASLQSPDSVPSKGAVSAAAPVIRPDTTAAEVQRMQQPWFQCLKEHDVPTRTTEEGLLDLDASASVNGRIRASEPDMVKACGKLEPVLAPELDEDRNPYWADDDDNYHKCLVEGGVDLVKKNGEWVPGPTWGEYSPNESLELRCQAKAFDGRKG